MTDLHLRRVEAELDWMASIIAMFCHLYGQQTAFNDPVVSDLIRSMPSTEQVREYAERHANWQVESEIIR